MKYIQTMLMVLGAMSLSSAVLASPNSPYPVETYDGLLDSVYSNPTDACKDRLAPEVANSGTTIQEGVCQDGSAYKSETTWIYEFTGVSPVGDAGNKRFSCMMKTTGKIRYWNVNCDGQNSKWDYLNESERLQIQANLCPQSEVWSPKRFLPINGGRHYLCLPLRTNYIAPSCPDEIKYGGPIVPAVGAKLLALNFGVFGLIASYDSRAMVRSNLEALDWGDPAKGGQLLPYHAQAEESFGLLWQSNHHKRLVTDVSEPVLIEGNHTWVSLKPNNSPSSSYQSVDGKYSLVRDSSSEWTLAKADGNVLLFSSDGKLRKQYINGSSYVYRYSGAATPFEVAPKQGLLISIEDQHGRKLDFSYRMLSQNFGRVGISRISFNGDLLVDIQYTDTGYIREIRWADQKYIQYHYEDAGKPWAVTGRSDENLSRMATYTYDDYGRASSTMLSDGVQKFEAWWDESPRPLVFDEYFDSYVLRTFYQPPLKFYVRNPLGQISESETISLGQRAVLASQSQPGGSGCGASTMKRHHDDRSNVISSVDFSGRRTCSAYESSRNLETTRLEGLLEADTCPADLPSYTIPANLALDKAQRKTSTQWHPVWHLKTREAEPKRITTWVYNGQPDPLNNNVEASCAPADALLPDGSKIAVLCKRYEQATSDETGNLGFAAPVLSIRSWSTTYNRHGQVLTETDPRGKTTSYEYWADTNFPAGDNNPAGEARGHTLGDLKAVVRPGNQTTRHTHYNKRGQVLRTELPHGGVEEREYHLRGWLTKVKQRATATATASLDTQYEYYPTGLLKLVTQADGSWQRYEYDDAHRLTDVIDSLGNKVHYTLDNAGNATQESHTDPSGVLVKAISRTYDTLGRLQSQKLGAH